MNTQSRVNGFEVIVHDGREITETVAVKVGGPHWELDTKRFKRRVNGPHTNALWAVHQRQRRCLQHAFTLPRVPKKGQECVT